MTETKAEGYTTIQLRKATRDRINNLRRGNETQDIFIKKLIDRAYPQEREE